MQLHHVVVVAPNHADVPPLLAALGVGKVLGGEKRVAARGATEDGVGLAHMFLEQAVELAVLGADDAECEFLVGGAQVLPFFARVDGLHKGLGTGEGSVDDVDVVDLFTAQKEGEADVPESLQPGAEDEEGVDGAALREEDGGGEGGAEGGEGGSGEEGVGNA